MLVPRAPGTIFESSDHDPGTALPVEEASYFVEKSRQVALLASSGADALAKSLVQFVKVKKNDVLPSLTVSPHLQAAPLSPSSVCISSDRSMNDSEAGILSKAKRCFLRVI